MLCCKQHLTLLLQNKTQQDWSGSPGFGATTSGREERNPVANKDDSNIKVLTSVKDSAYEE